MSTNLEMFKHRVFNMDEACEFYGLQELQLRIQLNRALEHDDKRRKRFKKIIFMNIFVYLH